MHINTKLGRLVDTLVDLASIKSGLALVEADFLRHLEGAASRIGMDEADRWWHRDRDADLRVEVTEVEESFLLVMHQIGAIRDTAGPTDLITRWVVANEFTRPIPSEERLKVHDRVVALALRILGQGETPGGMEKLAMEARRRYILDQHLPEVRAWDGIIPLRDLFHSEDIPAAAIPGQHFDQRFIDYLAAQPDRLEEIHWRQFEYLCGEFFQRNGYEVEITPPRGDGGIDVYARRPNSAAGPELVIIQAKRLSKSGTVEINDVKALWFDLDATNATRAIIATTSKLAAGARRICDAKQFRIYAAEEPAVRNWIVSMRTVGQQ